MKKDKGPKSRPIFVWWVCDFCGKYHRNAMNWLKWRRSKRRTHNFCKGDCAQAWVSTRILEKL